MNKRLLIVCLAALLLFVPHVASANSPARNPRELKIECTGVEQGTKIDVVLLSGSEKTRTAEDVFLRYGDQTTGYIYILFEDGETAFCLRVTASDGTETRTNEVPIEEYGSYRYDGAENRLEATGTYYSRAQSCGNGALILLYLLMLLILPLGLTLLIEFLVALCFRIRPKKYVLIINLITNPVMNVLLVVLTLLFDQSWVYWVALAVLEAAVVGLEFLFYTKKYRETSRGRLFAFTLTANLVSFAAGVIVAQLLL